MRLTLYTSPLHPYTEALLSAIPIPDPDRSRDRTTLQGEVPSPIDPPDGCFFHPRCPIAVKGICDATAPELAQSSTEHDHLAACHLRTGEHQSLDVSRR